MCSSDTLRNDLLHCVGHTGKHLTVWADCGPHFRSYEFLWNLVELCQTVFETVDLNFFAEHHGKGRCDGAFGLQRRWVADYARHSVIDSLDAMEKALQSGAAATMALDPPPHGPAYVIKTFRPVSKDVCKKLNVTGAGFQIEYTYCVYLDRGLEGHVRVWNRWFSDAEMRRKTLVGRAESSSSKVDADWRYSYRATQPERSPLNIALLQRRRDKQKDFANITGVTRRDPLLVALRKREKRLAHSRRKYQRQKRVLAVNLEEASGSSSSDDSSSTGE